jgi:carboxyl-terminal processing protease
MSSTQRKLQTTLLVVLIPLMLIAGIFLGGHPNDLPGFLRRAFVSGGQTQVVEEAIDRIHDDYYRPIAVSKLDDSSISGLVASLGDRFSHYLPPSEAGRLDAPPSFTGIGVSVAQAHTGLLIAHVFPASPALRSGLKSGEVITAVNGRRLQGLSLESAVALIKGLPGTRVSLGLEAPPAKSSHRAVERTVEITRAIVSEPVVASLVETVHGVKLGVVALAEFSPGAHGEVREAVEKVLKGGARGIVLDLRGNGGGLVEEAQLIASIFIAKGTIVTTRGRTQPTQVLSALGDPLAPSTPMVVLVDTNTASSAEILTAALQDHHRATVVGTHTFGKGVFQEEQPLSNGGTLDITVGEFFTPDGRNLGGGGVKQGAGITPEVKVPASQVDSERGLAVALATLRAKVR